VADRSEAPVETSTESIDDAVPTDDVAMTDAASDDTASEPAAAPEPEPEAAPEPEPESESEPDGESEPESEPEAEPADEPETPATPVLRPAPVHHSGDRIGNRYRLEECVTQAGVFTSWRAVDEKLRRAVGIHLLASGHQRASW
jgi:hypothetical protein